MRDYGTEPQVWGGDSDCPHEWNGVIKPASSGGKQDSQLEGGKLHQYGSATHSAQSSDSCQLCGAWRGSLGLEPTPELYVKHLVEIFRDVRRVLRDDGVLWLNLGDSYAVQGTSGLGTTEGHGKFKGDAKHDARIRERTLPPGLKPKDLCGIPWAVAKALQEPYYTGQIKNERDRVWLAATIDAEGAICGFRHRRKDTGRVRTGAHVFITNASTAMLDKAHQIWPASRVEHSMASEGHYGKLDVYRWIPQSAEKKQLLMAELYPYLIVKRKQALLAWNMFEFVKDGRRLGKSKMAQEVREKRELLTRLLSELNARKNIDVPSWCKEPPSLYEPGWWLRSDIIWSKPNCMPESVTDRPTKSHEYVFLLSKSARYFYDADAIREPNSPNSHGSPNINPGDKQKALNQNQTGTLGYWTPEMASGRNKRTVWTIPTHAYKQAHFATMAPALVEPMVLAGTSECGCCPECGAAWKRVTELVERHIGGGTPVCSESDLELFLKTHGTTHHSRDGMTQSTYKTIGWQPTCRCNMAYPGDWASKDDPAYAPYAPVPCTVLDPFSGAGTTGVVADRLGRDAILIDLSQEYAQMSKERIEGDAPMFVDVRLVDA